MTGSGTAAVLVAPVERAADGGWVVRSPGVGFWCGAPQPGAFLGEGSPLGTLRQLNRVSVLRLGPGTSGRIVEETPRSGTRAVEFGQALFRMQGLQEADAPVTPAHVSTAGLGAGERAVTAPTDGVFYRKPTPDAPELVRLGDRIRHAQPIGLIEVMKTFNPILYEARDPASEAEVIDVRVADATEVRAGDVLVVVRDV